MAEITTDEFMGEILNQLYENREVHQDHKGKGISFMILILFEQVGHLADAIARKDILRSKKEIFHVAAILYELYERIVRKDEGGKADGKLDSNAVGGSEQANGSGQTGDS